jgi:hypothetical protein
MPGIKVEYLVRNLAFENQREVVAFLKEYSK